MHRTPILFLVILISFNINAQGSRWKHQRHSLVASAGMTHFMGDLGGGSKDAAHFMGVRDLDFAATRPSLTINYRFRILRELAAKAGFGWAILAADDKNSGDKFRRLRNLHFRTHLFSFNLHAEYYFIKEKSNPRYSFSHLHSMRNFSAYLFMGVSFNMFNPKAKLDGKWISLQPLGTEGQGIDGNPPLYKKTAWGLPMGLGAKYALTRKISIGLEISNTYTTSDYIDDAHDAYYDNDRIRQIRGNEAARLADRHLNADGSPHTEPKPSGSDIRAGKDYNDAFILTVVTLTYKLKKDNRGLPKFH